MTLMKMEAGPRQRGGDAEEEARRGAVAAAVLLEAPIPEHARRVGQHTFRFGTAPGALGGLQGIVLHFKR